MQYLHRRAAIGIELMRSRTWRDVNGAAEGIKSRKFQDLAHDNPSSAAVIAKTFLLAETLYRYKVRILRDHGTWPVEYPVWYPYRVVPFAPHRDRDRYRLRNLRDHEAAGPGMARGGRMRVAHQSRETRLSCAERWPDGE